MGVTRRLRRDAPHAKCYSAQPSTAFHGLEGLKHMPAAIVPGIYDESLPDGNIWVDTEDAYAMVRYLARHEGLLVGISTGANVVAARELAKQIDDDGVIVTMMCDRADKYLSEHFWNDND
jgi:cysteine synthase B